MLDRRNLTQDDLHALARDTAIACQMGDAIALHGDLGAGKTSFARAFIRYLAGGDIDVPSPTFALVQLYDDLRVPVAHFDLYRLGDESELDELGLDETLASSIALIEWPERAGNLLPSKALHVKLTINAGDADRRDITIDGRGDILSRVEQSIAIRAFLKENAQANAWRRPLTGDASTRRYETITGRGNEILMIAPPQADGPPVRDGLPYSRLAHLAEDIRPFVVIGSALQDAGIRAPAIGGFDVAQGFMLLEDLGRGHLLDDQGMPVPDRYVGAGCLLASLHGKSVTKDLHARGLHHVLPDYDLSVFQIEAELLLDWFVAEETGRSPSTERREAFKAVMTGLWSQLDTSRFTILLRDYHSPNIVFDGNRQGTDQFGVIDFQDALWGPGAYDLMSLVHDARVTVPLSLGSQIMEAYCQQRAQSDPDFDRDAFWKEAAICTAQRLCKIMGIFHRLNRRDAKPAYLAHLPRVRHYFEHTLEHPVLAPLDDWWRSAGLRKSL
ncbi:MAG: tRNA (adenosine(37)-N6)-threonylcarbamoyltransferase complex ATPase subunit type 1 TsaE [Pseudomonadota bacterium]